jgi:hypothetical protein
VLFSTQVVVQVVGGRAFAVDDPARRAVWDAHLEERPWREQRRLAAVELVADVAAALETDVEAAFCPIDCVSAGRADGDTNASFYAYHGAGVGALPTLGLVGCRGSWDVPFPVFTARSEDLAEHLGNWDAVGSGFLTRNRRQRAWAARDSRAVFRGPSPAPLVSRGNARPPPAGKVRGKSCWRGDGGGLNGSDDRPFGDWRPCGRRALFAAADADPHAFDVAYGAETDRRFGFGYEQP